MNRIILIGNGFDLAHDLKTSYQNFIDDYWSKKHELLQNLLHSERKIESEQYEDDNIIINNIIRFGTSSFNNNEKKYGYNLFVDRITHGHIRGELHFKNRFLKHITESVVINNWVDIEEEYYRQLLDIKNGKIATYSINQLNSEFQNIKELLREYLKKVSENGAEIKKEIVEKFYSKINLRDLSAKGVESFIDEKIFEHELSQQILDADRSSWGIVYPTAIHEFPNWEKNYDSNTYSSRPSLFKKEKDLRDKIRDVLNDKYPLKNIFLTYPKKTLFLNFNYTIIDQLYISVQKPNLRNSAESDFSVNYGIRKESIHIHGELDKPNNPIIFGYGDEIGDEYIAIEKLNDNNYLENIKSMWYSETDNYKRLLAFINSDTYQVFIFGHSCGISDRTLLNTLFEHENCISIKPFYYKQKDGTDNYSELTRNISRNFTDKRLMREKVVNRAYSEPLI
jgi:hypothetical protein